MLSKKRTYLIDIFVLQMGWAQCSAVGLSRVDPWFAVIALSGSLLRKTNVKVLCTRQGVEVSANNRRKRAQIWRPGNFLVVEAEGDSGARKRLRGFVCLSSMWDDG